MAACRRLKPFTTESILMIGRWSDKPTRVRRIRYGRHRTAPGERETGSSVRGNQAFERPASGRERGTARGDRSGVYVRGDCRLIASSEGGALQRRQSRADRLYGPDIR